MATGQTVGSATGTGFKATYSTGLTEVLDYDKEGIGALRWEGNNCYKWVNYIGGTGAVDGVAGDAVFYVPDTGYAASQVEQDVTDAAGKLLGAGLLAAAIDISEFGTGGCYCWVQIKGFATTALAIAASVDSSPVAAGDGDPVVMDVATDGGLRRQNTVIDADAERYPQVGIAIDADAEEVYLDFPF